jgi:hypothetical protein
MVEEGLCQGGIDSSQKSCLCSIFLAACDLILGRGRSKKQQLCPNLNHSVPKVGMMGFEKGSKNGSKTSHTSVDLGNMMLLPKFGKTERVQPLQELGCSSSRLP